MAVNQSRLAKTIAIVAMVSLTLAGTAVFLVWRIFSPSVHVESAYRAVDDRGDGVSERVRLANAQADEEPPIGIAPGGPRIHKAGTLATLEYVAYDADGTPADRWQVRALVPPPIAIMRRSDDAFEGNSCPAECRAAVARGATILQRTGTPGIAAEWVLRMPLKQTFDLGRRSTTTQDLLDDRPRPVDTRRMTVTLVAACAARVQLASVSHLEVSPNAIVPIPKGFREDRWIQMDNCGPLDAFPPPPLPPPPPPRPPVPEPPQIRMLALRRATGRGFMTLDVDESWFASHPDPIEFVLRDVCRFDQAVDRWTKVTMPQETVGVRVDRRTGAGPGPGSNIPRVAVRLPEETALFFVRWVERKDNERSSRNQSLRDTLATSGPMLCEDLSLGPAPTGRVPACIPFENRAEARFVPDPRENCGR